MSLICSAYKICNKHNASNIITISIFGALNYRYNYVIPLFKKWKEYYTNLQRQFGLNDKFKSLCYIVIV